MVIIKDKQIYIANRVMSMVLYIRDDGKIELVHLGPVVAETDLEALRVKPCLGWGDSVLYEEKNTASCLERIPLFYSDAARSDYRESPVELFWQQEIPFAPDFVFKKAELVTASEKTASGLPLAKDPLEVLKITTASKSADLRLCHYVSVFDTAITRRCVMENLGAELISVAKLCSMQMDIPGNYSFRSFGGGWISEAHEDAAKIGQARVVNESVYGFSSSVHNPAVVLQEEGAGLDNGSVIGLNLIYTGNHYTSAQRSPQGLNRIVSGISPDHFRVPLAPGASFETPEAVISCSERGRNGLSRNMHAFVNGHVVPRHWQYRDRPVLYNNWEGTMFGFNEKKLVSLAKKAADLGCELFVLDDGWFGARNDDTAGLGDYDVNKKKLPSGIAGVAEKVRKLGMDFGLWFEPEAVNPDSALYRAHPEWAIHQESIAAREIITDKDGRLCNDFQRDLYGRNELLLDLRMPEVRDYIVENVGKIIDENGISYVKWDMNRQSALLGAAAHDYILGLYDVLSRIFEPRPKVLLESCSSGGNRFDLGMLCFGPQIWASDDTDPIERLDIQGGLFLMYPQSCWGSHVSASPHAQTLRATPLSTRGNVASFGCFGLELDLAFLSSAEEKEVREQIQYYKDHRKTFQFGRFRENSSGFGGFGNSAAGLGYYRNNQSSPAVCWQLDGEGETIVGLFHKLVKAVPEYEFLRAFLPDRNLVYSIESKPQSLRLGSFGPLVKHISPVAIDPDGAIMSAADRNIRLQDAVFKASASGAALSAGIPLDNLFLGTGYSKEMRMQGDFGSNLFLITPQPES